MHEYLPTEIAAADRIAARRRGRRLRRAGLASAALGLSLGTLAATEVAGATTPAVDHQAAEAPVAVGTVASVGSTSFTLTTRSATTVTVDVTAATTYRDRGGSATLAALTVGSHVAVAGSTSGSTVQATSVLIGLPTGGPAGHGPMGAPGGAAPAAVGTVASVGSTSFTLTTRSATIVTVDVTAATTYRDRGGLATLAALTVGSHVAVAGSTSGSTVQATSVLIGLPGGHASGAGQGPEGAPAGGGSGWGGAPAAD